VPAARPRLGQPELFEAQRQVRRLSEGELMQGKAPGVRAREMVFLWLAISLRVSKCNGFLCKYS
jgi:hypothetical protein